MCEARPGLRCDSDANAALNKLGQRLKQMVASPDKAAELALVATRYQHALWDASTSQAALDRFRAEARSDDPEVAGFARRRLRAGQAMIAARAEQVRRMPPKGAGSADEKASRRAIGQAREQIAYAQVDEEVFADDPEQVASARGRQHLALQTLRQHSAEWCYDLPEVGGRCTHCGECGEFAGPGHACGEGRPGTPEGDSTSKVWDGLVAAAPGDPEARSRVAAAAEYMQAHGHMQCPVCGQWRSIRIDNHTCPKSRVVAEYPAATFQSYRTYSKPDTTVETDPLSDREVVVLPGLGPVGEMGEAVVAVDDGHGGEQMRHGVEVTFPDGSTLAVPDRDTGEARLRRWFEAHNPKVKVVSTRDGLVVLGTERGDGTNEVLKKAGLRYNAALGWHDPKRGYASGDQAAQIAAALRRGGFSAGAFSRTIEGQDRALLVMPEQIKAGDWVRAAGGERVRVLSVKGDEVEIQQRFGGAASMRVSSLIEHTPTRS